MDRAPLPVRTLNCQMISIGRLISLAEIAAQATMVPATPASRLLLGAHMGRFTRQTMSIAPSNSRVTPQQQPLGMSSLFRFIAPSQLIILRRWCGVHVTQYQKNEVPNTPNYQYYASVYDANQHDIGDGNGAPATGDSFDIATLLNPLTIIAGAVDSDPVGFEYNGASWDSSSSQCSVGGYDGGERQMDCGFTC